VKHSSTIHTADGSIVTIRPHGAYEYDLETKNAKGETVSTVVMSRGDVRALMNDAEEALTW
jgi:hypothetical protein